MKKYFPIFLILTFLTLYAGYEFGLFKLPFGSAAAPFVIAHRGDSTHATENTMAAFKIALQGGADGIELDVRTTKDQVPLVFHDANLKRILKANCRVDELNADELGKWSATSASAQKYADTTSICSLEEVLLLCSNHPGTKLILDLKVSDTEEKVVSLIEKYDLSGQCEISSGDPAVLQEIKKLNPEIRTVLLISSVGDLLAYKYGDILSRTQTGDARSAAMSADGISVRSSFITASLVRSAHRRNRYIYAWTVNSASGIRRMCHIGVDAIITDDPSFATHCIYSDH